MPVSYTHLIRGQPRVERIGILGRGVAFQKNGFDPDRIVPSEAGGKAVDARQLTAVVGEAAQQHRTALRKVYDGGDLFAAPLGFVRGNEERQPRLYRNGNFGGDQRRKSRPESGTPLQIAV